jgi:iron complex outermembrane recepter protein
MELSFSTGSLPCAGSNYRGALLKTNYRITCAVLTALGAHSAAHAAEAASDVTVPESSDVVQSITVTAQRRSESIQDVPITIQAMTGDDLRQLNVVSLQDVVKYLPNVSYGADGPGQGDIFMRGLSAGGNGGNQSTATFAPFPNVAVYLDDQSLQFPGRNLDVYMVDMNRIEVLEGPQGTLFGGGAEAGAIRYITNKPDLTTTGGNVEASYGITSHGDPNHYANATLNLPVVDGVFALRGVIYTDHRGGYIDNLPSTFTRSNSDSAGGLGYLNIPAVNGVCPAYPVSNGLPSSTGLCVPGTNVVANNYGLVGEAQNPVDYGGIRVSGLWKVNEDWNVLLVQSYQDMEADGSFAQYPVGSDYGVNPAAPQVLGPWQGTFFSPAYDKDSFENTALTITGKIGDLKAIYTGAYMVRHVEQTADYTNYARSTSGYYYSCAGGNGTGFGTPGSPRTAGTPPVCYSPVSSWHDKVRNGHLSNELRLSTPDDWRLRGLFGVYQENFNITDDMNFLYKTIPSCTPANLAIALAGGPVCVANVGPVPSSYDVDSSLRNDNTAFGEDVRRGYSQYAAFTSIDFDLIPKVLTLTGGTRYYHYNEYEFGTKYTTNEGCQNVPNGECTGGVYGGGTVIGGDLASSGGGDKSYSGFRSRANLTWHITDDAMAYYTFSQGFRPGGFNRNVAGVAKLAGLTGSAAAQYLTPAGYAPDSLTNNEVGWKTEWFDHRVQFNGSVYRMNWNDVQFTFFDPAEGFGNTNFVVNGPDYRINGVELQLVAKPVTGLTLQAAGAWNSATQTNNPCLLGNNPLNPTFGQCITHDTKSAAIANPIGLEGTRPAFSPPQEFSLRALYEWLMANDLRGFITAGASHVGHMSNEPLDYPPPVPGKPPFTTRELFDQPGYTTYDASLGVSKNAWTITLYGQNLSNSDASIYTSTAQYIVQEIPLRPRVVGLKVDYSF